MRGNVYENKQCGLPFGDVKFDIYIGKIRFGGQEYDIPVHVGTDLSEVLLGRQWLKNMRLIVDISSNVLTLGN